MIKPSDYKNQSKLIALTQEVKQLKSCLTQSNITNSNQLTLLSDREIIELCIGDNPMLSPFIPELVRKINIPVGTFYSRDSYGNPVKHSSDDSLVTQKVISYGLSSYGYDLQLSPTRFRVFKKKSIYERVSEALGLSEPKIIDPKNFDESLLIDAKQYSDHTGIYWIMPPHSAALGTTPTRFNMPRNVIGIALGKSTYARCAVNPIVTPAESGWKGHLTLEFVNNSDYHCKIYANEGVLQMLFLRGAECDVSYADRKGKYQDQGEEVVLARV